MMQYVTNAGTQGICPSGWHIPTDAELCTVNEFLYPTGDCSSVSNGFAGGKMKSTGTIEAGTGLWRDLNYGATNESGFSAVPAGFRFLTGSFGFIGYYGYLWSSTENDTGGVWGRGMNYNNGYVDSFYDFEDYGFSVRCLRDF